MKAMKMVLLAGGLGTRLREETVFRPKPMVEIGGVPILVHIMKICSHYGINDFVICLGYKGEMIKDYFLRYHVLNADLTVDLATGDVHFHGNRTENWRVTLVDTGQQTMTGGRIKRIREYVGDSTFMATYGDGVADIDLTKLLQYHKARGKVATVTAVRPPSRFGEIVTEDGIARAFTEKPQVQSGWINGGFFVFEPAVFDYIAGDATSLEREPLERLAQDGQLAVYSHHGYWRCMDTQRDLEALNEEWAQGRAGWRIWGKESEK